MPRSKSLLIRGHLGIGKSALVKQAANILSHMDGEEVALVDIRLSQQDVGDLRGIPYLVGGNTFFAPPMWYPIEANYLEKQKTFLKESGHNYIPWQTFKKGIIFLDELNRATREVLQCSFELTLDHKLGGVPIPEGWLVVAAVNHDAKVYEIHKLDPAHINRFLVVDFNPNAQEWVDYASVRTDNGDMHPAVLDYIVANPSKLDPSDKDLEDAARTGRQVATRRSWTTLAEVLQETPDLDPQDDYTALLVEACIGPMHMANFLSFLQTRRETVPPKKIVDAWDSKCGEYLGGLIDDGMAHELASTSHSVLDYLLRIRGPLTQRQNLNVIEFACVLPDEMAADFYKSWKEENPVQAQACYNTQGMGPDGSMLTTSSGKPLYPMKKRMLSVFKNPDGT